MFCKVNFSETTMKEHHEAEKSQMTMDNVSDI